MSQREKGNTQAAAAAKAGISERTGRRIEREDGKPESKGRHRRTRNDPFAGVWDEVAEKLGSNPELLPLNQVVFRANSPTNSAEEPIFAIKGRIVSLTALLLLSQALARKSPQGNHQAWPGLRAPWQRQHSAQDHAKAPQAVPSESRQLPRSGRNGAVEFHSQCSADCFQPPLRASNPCAVFFPGRN